MLDAPLHARSRRRSGWRAGLPGCASALHRDTRAPLNLTPIAAGPVPGGVVEPPLNLKSALAARRAGRRSPRQWHLPPTSAACCPRRRWTAPRGRTCTKLTVTTLSDPQARAAVRSPGLPRVRETGRAGTTTVRRTPTPCLSAS